MIVAPPGWPAAPVSTLPAVPEPVSYTHLDVYKRQTGTWQLFGPSPKAVADQIRQVVRDETGLTLSVGVSFNKVFAKLGSDYKKPYATTVIGREDFKRMVLSLIHI